MREILFRGKRLDNDEWIEGSLWLNGARALIRADLGFPFGASWCEVDPASVGQFIGVLDKRGERIFEGDIVQDERLCVLGEVVWLGRNPSFVIKDVCRGMVYNDDHWEDSEVIASAYESREILDIAYEGLKRILKGVSCDA